MTSDSDPSPGPAGGELTHLLRAWAGGDARAGDELFQRVYPQLKALASRRLAAEPRAGVQTTELVHEAFLKLAGETRVSWRGRAQFFALAAQQMRRILVDLARHRNRQKRGSGALHVTLDERSALVSGPDVDVISLDVALVELGDVDARAARVVELRFFAGLSAEETAEVIGVSRPTIMRSWRFGRAFLARKLRPA